MGLRAIAESEGPVSVSAERNRGLYNHLEIDNG